MSVLFIVYLLHLLPAFIESFMAITGKIRAGKGSVLFVAQPQAQPLPVSMNVLFCVHIANMSEEVSFLEYDCLSSFKVQKCFGME